MVSLRSHFKTGRDFESILHGHNGTDKVFQVDLCGHLRTARKFISDPWSCQYRQTVQERPLWSRQCRKASAVVYVQTGGSRAIMWLRLDRQKTWTPSVVATGQTGNSWLDVSTSRSLSVSGLDTQNGHWYKCGVQQTTV